MSAFATCPHCGEEIRRGAVLVDDETGKPISRWQHRDPRDPMFWRYRCSVAGIPGAEDAS